MKIKKPNKPICPHKSDKADKSIGANLSKSEQLDEFASIIVDIYFELYAGKGFEKKDRVISK